MNRLVIIGNGFDLAHGLPTGYCDFIDWFWRNYKENRNNPKFKSIIELDENYNGVLIYSKIEKYSDLINSIKNYAAEYGYQFHNAPNKVYLQLQRERVTIITYHNYFFYLINEKYSIENWIDIENTYYELLKDCLNELLLSTHHILINKLNEDFEAIKDLFEKYLMDEVYNKYNFDKPNHEINTIIKEFNVWNRVTDKDDFREEFPQNENEVTEFINILSEYRGSGKRNVTQYLEGMNIEVKNYFLSFNYTPTLDVYLSKMQDDYNAIHDDKKHFGQNTLIQIHGRLNDDNNLINFGFGDEMDDDYKNIERKNNNEYLKYIKSFQYTQNNNYKKLLDFIDSQKFQVYIMGHSCGLSDRILLNTIFEHENCRSIKIYFHQKDDGSNNYTDIVQNISRHFNDKKVMRSKIVNKSLCEPLHQEVRFDKKTN